MLSCPSCKGRFAKTLESRILIAETAGQTGAILTKKRCKRCKTDFLAHLSLCNHQPVYAYATPCQWHQAQKIKNHSSHGAQGPYPLVGRYTALICQSTANVYEQVLRRHTRVLPSRNQASDLPPTLPARTV